MGKMPQGLSSVLTDLDAGLAVVLYPSPCPRGQMCESESYFPGLEFIPFLANLGDTKP